MPSDEVVSKLTAKAMAIEDTLSSSHTTTSGFLVGPKFNYQIRGGWAGQVDLERKLPGTSVWCVVAGFTVNISASGTEPESGTLYRFVFSTTTSGNPIVRLSRDWDS